VIRKTFEGMMSAHGLAGLRPAAPKYAEGLVPKLVFLTVDGGERVVDGTVGDSVMKAAVQHGVPGVVAECGGNCSCATCHVWVADEFLPLVGEPEDMEEDLLDMAVTDRRQGSRLSCQITVTEDLDGLTVEIPPVQP
jgi:2Fe-2S ferredoxin